MLVQATAPIRRDEILSQACPAEDSSIIIIHPPGPLMGKRFPLRPKRNIIGRNPESDLRLNSHTVSRQHAVIRQNCVGWLIEDLKSTNGLLINNVPKAKGYLNNHDIVTLGDTSLKFLVGNGVEAAYHEQIYRLTITDPLTQIRNRRFFFEYLEHELALAHRYGYSVSVIMIDLDHFKLVNDTYGHPAGDHVLVQLAARIGRRIRRTDVFARYGGEEFAIMLSHTSRDGALLFAEKLRELITLHPFRVGDKQVELSISLGVAASREEDGRNPSAIVIRADRNLYRAKLSGRDCVVG